VNDHARRDRARQAQALTGPSAERTQIISSTTQASWRPVGGVNAAASDQCEPERRMLPRRYDSSAGSVVAWLGRIEMQCHRIQQVFRRER